mmetsp:Transcript_45864/g.132316  ORF Transcript_45864/g.132316 Transcript_45864/m.132316 type:complete len:334 (-) Transcript_45864:169-1170(-)
MAGICGVEYHKDIIGERLYASRNFNHLQGTYQAPGANRAQVDWALTLRQVRKPQALSGSASAPNLSEPTQKRESPLAPEHPDGTYHGEGPTVGKYQNYGATNHLVKGGTRCAGPAHTINWMLNLRDGLHRNEHAPEQQWRRHCLRSHQSFDMMAENCSRTNEAYQRSHITPQDRRPDRRSGAIAIETIRDDPISFKRYPGCEGTQVGQWRHLVEDKRFGHKIRQHIRYETTLREDSRDPNGARIQDNRTDGCIVEMMGKKRWHGAAHHEPLAQRLPHGDPKLAHVFYRKTLPQQDEESRQLRMQKAPRTDANISEAHQPKGGRAHTMLRSESG